MIARSADDGYTPLEEVDWLEQQLCDMVKEVYSGSGGGIEVIRHIYNNAGND